MSQRDDRTLAGLLFVGVPAGFLTVLMIGAAMAPGYHVGADAISDLGVIDETALLFNGAMVLTGLANALGGYYFYRVHGARWLLGLFALSGIGSVGVGVFPLTTGAAHGIAAMAAFVGLNLEAIGTARVVDGAMQGVSVVAGVLGLLALAWFVAGGGEGGALYGQLGYGGVERLIVYPGLLWAVTLGGSLLTAD